MEKINTLLNYLKENPLVSDVRWMIYFKKWSWISWDLLFFITSLILLMEAIKKILFNNIMDSMLNVKNMAIMVLSKKLHLPYSKENFYNEHGRTIVLLIEKMIEDSKKKLEFGRIHPVFLIS
jgi:hypothetical protein